MEDKNEPGTAGALVTKTFAGVEFEFSYIPAGTFQMGAPASDTEADSREQPQHQVTLTKPFLMLRNPVTQAQYQAVTGSNPSYFTDDTSRPVERVSWYDALEFCNGLSRAEGLLWPYRIDEYVNAEPYWEAFFTGAPLPKLKRRVHPKVTWRDRPYPYAGYRLPTEAEWEYACRAGTTTPRYGNVEEIAWTRIELGGTHPVKTKLPNDWNLYDMLGNVQEWCWGARAPYGSDALTDPHGSLAGDRVCRGGSWLAEPGDARASSRSVHSPTHGYVNLGFRVVRALP